MFGLKTYRRRKLMRQPLPVQWLAFLHKNVPYTKTLPNALQKKLHGFIQVFIHEKRFEGCGGLEINDKMKVTIAGQACILMLGIENPTTLYPNLRSILVYPQNYFAEVKNYHEGGIVEEGIENRHGEAWAYGHVVLAWDKVKKGAANFRDGQNLVFHEFAHHLDFEYGLTEQAVSTNAGALSLEWARVLGEEYEAFLHKLHHKQQTLFDAYGAENIEEFFAVITECFFEQPHQMQQRHGRLYEQLSSFYKQDPAGYLNQS